MYHLWPQHQFTGCPTVGRGALRRRGLPQGRCTWSTNPGLITLRRSGVDPQRVYIDTTSGAEASRPKWDLARALLRSGDTLVITRLDRLDRSMLHLVILVTRIAC
jgi:hypothetical protein